MDNSLFLFFALSPSIVPKNGENASVFLSFPGVKRHFDPYDTRIALHFMLSQSYNTSNSLIFLRKLATFRPLALVSSYHIGKKECVRNVEKITESCENLRSLSHITLEKALLYHKKYKKTRKNALQEIDKKIQLCYN